MLKKVRKEESQQLDMMDEVDRYEQAAYERRAAAIREKLETQYMRPNERYGVHDRDVPDGQVVILVTDGRTQKSDKLMTRYFRCVAGHHNTVGGEMLHLISAPNEEWPDEPVWQAWHGCRWIYPVGGMYIRREPEFEPEIAWGECGECYGHCDDCEKKSGPYPKCRKS